MGEGKNNCGDSDNNTGVNVNILVRKLNKHEIAVLPFIKERSEYRDIAERAEISPTAVMRALQWLSNKQLVVLKDESKELIELGSNGKNYAKDGLPEKRFLKQIKGRTPIEEIDLPKDEINVCIGTLKKKAAIEIYKDNGLEVEITDAGKKLLEKDSLEELFIKGNFPKEIRSLSAEEKFAFDNLSKRKDIVISVLDKKTYALLTDLGKKVIAHGLPKGDMIETLTQGMLKDGSWKDKEFKRYDISINVPKTQGGKRHFVNVAIEYARRIWLDMGFKEMTGPMLQTSFWNFDALFTAQDHPVRELQDTFYIKNPENGKLPGERYVRNVKAVHENGGDTNSTGWMYKWDEKNAMKNVLRTHTTVLSAQTIAMLKESELPVKYFALGKCFRNETLDWSHLFEFNQTEGIVVDPNATFPHLLGYLKEFFKKMGYPKARFRPAYFPYTEMSVEIDVMHPVNKKWMELGGAGIFRPEVVVPLLGRDVPVLAWGPGFDRIIMEDYEITDIRDLYKNDIKQLRNMKMWMR
ncbi:phenylalanine--tRNA ligase subunit alpha [Candidatus Woesearchaeota archaeon]|nr:phenylalanine--tRNA ligase subunit alpha [Candidatus Woesearchaeota archaeon]